MLYVIGDWLLASILLLLAYFLPALLVAAVIGRILRGLPHRKDEDRR